MKTEETRKGSDFSMHLTSLQDEERANILHVLRARGRKGGGDTRFIARVHCGLEDGEIDGLNSWA